MRDTERGIPSKVTRTGLLSGKVAVMKDNLPNIIHICRWCSSGPPNTISLLSEKMVVMKGNMRDILNI